MSKFNLNRSTEENAIQQIMEIFIRGFYENSSKVNKTLLEHLLYSTSSADQDIILSFLAKAGAVFNMEDVENVV